MNKCPHCGKEHAEGAVFCMACGKPMNQTAAHEREVAEARAEAAANERTRVTEITARCAKHSLPQEFVDGLVNKGVALDKAIPAILDEIRRALIGRPTLTRCAWATVQAVHARLNPPAETAPGAQEAEG